MQNETDNSQPQADNPNEQPLARFVISEDGTEVTDNNTGLICIVDMSRRDPSIDTDVFPGTPGSAFFTSSPDGALSWFVSFYVGKVFSEYNAIPNHVRLVRSS